MLLWLIYHFTIICVPIMSKVNIDQVPSSAYIHIPFCRRRCFYCDFPVFVLGDRLRGETSLTVAKYVEMLCTEIAGAPVFNLPLETIFFGGGTPSLLAPEQLANILNLLEKRFGFSRGIEISLEIDPGTFDLPLISAYRHLGINRLSLGVQAFQDDLLQHAGRSHSVRDILTAVELIHQVGFDHFSLDLISGLPHQTITQWQASLHKAIGAAATHISIYDLTIEPGTAFGRYYQPGDRPLPSDETTVEMYRMGQALLTQAGYEHYEISNYGRSQYQCRHNRVYWENRPYYGFGMGAASYIQGKRFTRPRQTQQYYQWVQLGAVIDCEVTSPIEELLETLMLGLRLAEGLSWSRLEEICPKSSKSDLAKIKQCLQPYIAKGWVEVESERFRLSDPEGFLFSNVVLSTLFKELTAG